VLESSATHEKRGGSLEVESRCRRDAAPRPSAFATRASRRGRPARRRRGGASREPDERGTSSVPRPLPSLDSCQSEAGLVVLISAGEKGPVEYLAAA
jgi:hypothetical protein